MTDHVEQNAIDRLRDDPAAHRDCYPLEMVDGARGDLKAAHDAVGRALERIR